jgi:hypothetical protein
MKLIRSVCLAFAGAVIMIAFYFASARMGALAAGPSIDRLALSRYQEYAPTDFVGEKTIARNAFSWRHETWTGDDRPFRQARQVIDTAIASGQSPMRVAIGYEEQARADKRSALAQFRWGYALRKTITPASTPDESQTNGLGVFFTLANIASPNTYNYARLRYLTSYHSSYQTALGERLLRQDTQDVSVKGHLALDYTTPGPEPYNLEAKKRAIELSTELIKANPRDASYHAVLAEAYYMSYYSGGRRQDAVNTIMSLNKYLSLAKPDEAFYETAKSRVADLNRKLSNSQE